MHLHLSISFYTIVYIFYLSLSQCIYKYLLPKHVKLTCVVPKAINWIKTYKDYHLLLIQNLVCRLQTQVSSAFGYLGSTEINSRPTEINVRSTEINGLSTFCLRFVHDLSTFCLRFFPTTFNP